MKETWFREEARWRGLRITGLLKARVKTGSQSGANHAENQEFSGLTFKHKPEAKDWIQLPHLTESSSSCLNEENNDVVPPLKLNFETVSTVRFL